MIFLRQANLFVKNDINHTQTAQVQNRDHEIHQDIHFKDYLRYFSNGSNMFGASLLLFLLVLELVLVSFWVLGGFCVCFVSRFYVLQVSEG
jgi:hypothetical protein